MLRQFLLYNYANQSLLYMYITSLLNLPPISLPKPPLQVDTEPLFEFPEPSSKFPLAMYFTHGNVSYHVTLSIHPTLSLLPSPHVHKSVLYVCVSIAALKIISSVPSFQIPYICITIWYLSFYFWLTSLCIICSRFIHLIRTDSNAFLFMAE